LNWPIVGVVGGCGGTGASTFACVLAATAVSEAPAVLVDLDPVAGGIDVLLGIEAVPGARWSGLRLSGGRLDPGVLAEGLPQWASVAVLSADVMPEADVVAQALDVASRAAPVIVDLGRWDNAARRVALERCGLVVLLCGSDVRSVTGARAVALSLGDQPVGVVVVRAGRDLAPASRIAELVGSPLVGVIPCVPRRDDAPLDPRSLPRAMAGIARGVLDAVGGLEAAA
jgi:secretion/DNA translocation related CpaE-like protein